jgi:hypothetical protein
LLAEVIINEIDVSHRIGDDWERFIQNLIIENQVKNPIVRLLEHRGIEA